MFVCFYSPTPAPPTPPLLLTAPPSTRPCSPPSACCPLISLPGASVCLTSATSSSSSGNYLAALRCLLIFVSTCRNICFGVSFVNAGELPCLLRTSCPLSLTLTKRSTPPDPRLPPSNACLHCSGKEEKISPAQSHCSRYLLWLYSSQWM